MSSNESSNKPEAYLFDQYLSMVDLSKHPRFVEYSEEWDEKILEEMLYSLGADIYACGYEMMMQDHRPRTSNKVIHCQRFTFTERTDAEWVKYGMQVEDMVRNTKSEISRVGCMLALNNIHNVAEATQAKMMNNVSNVNIACKE